MRAALAEALRKLAELIQKADSDPGCLTRPMCEATLTPLADTSKSLMAETARRLEPLFRYLVNDVAADKACAFIECLTASDHHLNRDCPREMSVYKAGWVSRKCKTTRHRMPPTAKDGNKKGRGKNGEIICFSCNVKGHLSRNCPSSRDGFRGRDTSTGQRAEQFRPLEHRPAYEDRDQRRDYPTRGADVRYRRSPPRGPVRR